MTIELKIGDVVRAKSGGPLMTVGGLLSPAKSGRERVTCLWFSKDDIIMRDVFFVDTLKVAE